MVDYFLSFGIPQIVSHLSFSAGAVIVIWINKKIRRMRLRKGVEKAYIAVQGAYEPETLNPEHPGNPSAMRADARNYVNMLRPRLERAGLYPPQPLGVTDDSLQLWFNYLESVRPQL